MSSSDARRPGGLGTRRSARVSAGSAIAQAAHAITRRAASQLLADGRYDAMFETSVAYGELNALFQERAAGPSDRT